MSASLLYGIESRGFDATGAAWTTTTGKVEFQRQAAPARKFIKDTLSVPRRARNVILHTRFATQGDEKNNLNNHPIRVGPIVGVHNGILYNDDHLFWRLEAEDKRQAQVDSEAIWATLNYGPGKMSGVSSIADCLEEIEGSAAIAWLNDEDPAGTLHLARLQSSPLIWAQTEGGSLLFASTLDAIEESAEVMMMKLTRNGAMPEGQYVRIVEGMNAQTTNFKPARSYSSRSYTTFVGKGRLGSVWGDDGDDWERDYCPVTPRPVVKTSPVLANWTATMLDPDTEVMRSQSHDVTYRNREAALDAWMKNVQADDQSMLSLAITLKSFARKGDWVSTTLWTEDVYGQLYDMPQEFPGGWYTLKVYCPAPDGAWEAVLVRRHSEDFDLLEASPFKALPLAAGAGVDEADDEDLDEQDMAEVIELADRMNDGYDDRPTQAELELSEI